MKKRKPRNGGTKQSAEERNLRFIEAYLTLGENATRAYLEVNPGVTTGTASVEGHRLLKIPKIQKAIAARRAELRAQYALTTDRVFQEVARISYFNPKRLVDDKGKAIPLHKLDDDTAAALANVEVIETIVTGKGKDKVVTTRRLKGRPFNKPTALEKGIKILRLYDKPPPPPPDEEGRQAVEDPIELAKRMAFLLAKGDAEKRRAAAAPHKPAKKRKLEVAT